jgi:hypothetical protein
MVLAENDLDQVGHTVVDSGPAPPQMAANR